MFNTSLAFFAGQLVLLALLFTVWRYFSGTPDLLERIAGIRQYNSKRRRTEKFETELKRSAAEHSLIRRKLERTKKIVADQVEGTDTHALLRMAIRYALLTVVMFEADAALLMWLNGRSQLFGLGPLDWAPFASSVAFGVLLVFHLGLESAIGDSETPSLTRKRARIGVWMAAAVVGVSLWATLTGRGADFVSEDWAASVVEIGFWVLTLAVALAGAFASTVAVSAFEEAQPESRLVTLESQDQAYTQHVAAVTAELKELTASPPDDPSGGQNQVGDGAARFPRAAGATAAALILGLLVLTKGPAAYAEPVMPTIVATELPSVGAGAGV